MLNKRGLLDALSRRGEVRQLDYLAIPVDELFVAVVAAVDEFQPTVLLTQLHGSDRLTAENLRDIRTLYPSLIICNWSGDSWLHGLTAPNILEMCRQFDLQLIAAPDVLPIYEREDIRAAYWQIAYEAPVGDLPDVPSHDVVFLANVISDPRRKLLEFLRELKGVNVGIYGDWEQADGRNVYDFGAGEALYKKCKIAIADMAYPEQVNYVSNRPIQALIAGGGVLMHQYVPKMEEMMGLRHMVHYMQWRDFEELERLIRTYIQPKFDPLRVKIVDAGRDYARAHHTYDQRVTQLFDEYLPMLEGVKA